MKRIAQLSLTGFLVCTSIGCQSSSLAKFHPREYVPFAKNEKTETNSNPELEASLLAANSTQQTLDNDVASMNEIRAGQREIAAWYEDQRNEHIKAARKHFEAALEMQPRNNAEAHHGLAATADLEKNFAKAEQHYQIALALSPKDSRLLGNLGYSYLLQNRLAESQRYLERALEIDPTNGDAIRNLGDVYAKLGRKDQALATYSKIMPAAEAALLVSQTQQPPQADSPVKRLMSKTEAPPKEDLTQKILEQKAELLRQSQQQSLQSRSAGLPGSSPMASSPLSAPPYSQPGLQSQLAAIDREPYSQVSNRPIIIDGATGDPRFGQGDGGPVSTSNLPAVAQSAHIIPTPLPASSSPIQSVHHLQQPDSMGMQVVTAAMSEVPTSASISQASAVGAGTNYQDQLRKPWSGNLHSQNSQMPASPTTALNTVPQSAQLNRSAASQLATPPVDPFAMHPMSSTAAENPEDSFKAASLAAARLGMGLPRSTSRSTSTGELTSAPSPAVSQATPQQVPGSNSFWNGGQFPQPQRFLPTDAAPQDLHQAQHLEAVNTSLHSSLGQTVPQSAPGQFTSAPATVQFGTASRFENPQPQGVTPTPWNGGTAQPDLTKSSSLSVAQQWNDEKEAFNRQLNQAIQQGADSRPIQRHQAEESLRLKPAAEYGGMVQSASESQYVIPQPYNPSLSGEAGRTPSPSSPRVAQAAAMEPTPTSAVLTPSSGIQQTAHTTGVPGVKTSDVTHAYGMTVTPESDAATASPPKVVPAAGTSLPGILPGSGTGSTDAPRMRLLPAGSGTRHGFSPLNSETVTPATGTTSSGTMPLIRPTP